MTKKTIYGISDAARLAGVSEGTLRNYDKAGVITPIRDSEGRRLFTDSDINAVKKYRGDNKTK